jgi:hypothetical protein
MCSHTTHTTVYYYICVLILLYIGTQADDAVLSDASSFAYTAYAGPPPYSTIYVSSYCYICVLILLHMCPHTAIYVSAYYCMMCVLILLYVCPHTTAYVSSYCYICVRILVASSLAYTVYARALAHTT